MQIWDNHSTSEILRSIEQEIAKAQNEINCASKDVHKAKNRLSFATTALHNLKKRDLNGDMK